MLKILTLAAVVNLTLTISSGRADEPKPDEAKNQQGIQADVRGIRHFESGRGYFITVKPADKAERETRVWLRAAEDKELVGKMAALIEKEVIARGKLAQMPQGVQANVPPLGIYLHHGFRIERAGAK